MSNPGATILVIDDEEPIRQSLQAILQTRGYQVLLAASGEEGIVMTAHLHPALVILDLVMPGMGGLKTCEMLRGWYREPILILSAIEQDKDKITALQSGADDYVTKPFSIGELLARIEVHLRRMHMLVTPALPPVMVVGALQIDMIHRSVTLEGRKVNLTPVEYKILVLLAGRTNCVVPTRTLLQHLWGEAGSEMDSRPLHTHIAHLRKKIATTPATLSQIRTEHGIGFRLVSGEIGD